MTLLELQQLIQSKLPLVVPKHDERGHWYEVPSLARVLPSVTTCLQVVKDDSIRNWRLNRAVDYVFANHSLFTPENIMEHLESMKRVSVDLLEDAGDIGTAIHSLREQFFKKTIDPNDIRLTDVRAQSAVRALNKFLGDT